jgi:hypothetical protein
MNEKETNALVKTLEAAMRGALHSGRNNTRLEVTRLASGLTEISGTFDLSKVARACLAAIERSNYKLVPGESEDKEMFPPASAPR